jgi:hypothetical protein
MKVESLEGLKIVIPAKAGIQDRSGHIGFLLPQE